jgi:hypothetical protein
MFACSQSDIGESVLLPKSSKLNLGITFTESQRSSINQPRAARLRLTPAHDRSGFRQKAGLFIFPKNAAPCRDAATVDE